MKYIHQVTPRQGIILGLLTAGMGLLIILSAADVIPTDDEMFHAPRVLVSLAGVVFFLPGLFMLYYGVRNYLYPELVTRPVDSKQFQFGGWILAALILTCLGLIGTWAAFGPGPREFEGGITGTEVEGRIAFGIGAVITDILALGVWVYGLRHLIAKWKRR